MFSARHRTMTDADRTRIVAIGCRTNPTRNLRVRYVVFSYPVR
ncbi:Uncharacterised protein [Amycolatopsis camponoti]|uniref:Uncharacterized protein n=1 Tax=Amycolatopsis camponoti TaxID=2606593 RepID=A0A6I8LJN6_9PSEU|nr:Uncharacterised protein [Amycolatopsis camponoti]